MRSSLFIIAGGTSKFDIISIRLICRIFVDGKLYIKQLTPNTTPHIM